MALRTSKLSKNCASRGLVGPFRRAARGLSPPPPPPLATCLLADLIYIICYRGMCLRSEIKKFILSMQYL